MEGRKGDTQEPLCSQEIRSFSAIKRVALDNMTIDGLADQFVALALDQYNALIEDNVALYNNLFRSSRYRK